MCKIRWNNIKCKIGKQIKRWKGHTTSKRAYNSGWTSQIHHNSSSSSFEHHQNEISSLAFAWPYEYGECIERLSTESPLLCDRSLRSITWNEMEIRKSRKKILRKIILSKKNIFFA